MKKIPLNNKIKIYTIFIFCVTFLFVLIAFTFNQISPDRWQASYKIRTNPEVIIYLKTTQAVISSINGEGSTPKLLEMIQKQIQSITEMLDRKKLKTTIRITNDYLVIKLIDGENEDIDEITKEIIDIINKRLKVIVNNRLNLYYKISLEGVEEAKELKLSQLVNFINFIDSQGSVYKRKRPLEDSERETEEKRVNFELNNVIQYFMFNEPYNPVKFNALEEVMNEESYESLLESLRVLRWQIGNYKVPDDNSLIKLRKLSKTIESLDVIEIDFLDNLINRKPGIFSALFAGVVMGLFASISLLYFHLLFPFKKLKKLLFSENSKRKKNSH